MKFSNMLSDDAVIEEMGRRIATARLARNITQAQLADAAGVSKSTIERLEDGASTQLTNLIRCLRVLDKLDGLERLLPDVAPNPIELLERQRAQRRRARSSKSGRSPPTATTAPIDAPATPGWVWGDKK